MSTHDAGDSLKTKNAPFSFCVTVGSLGTMHFQEVSGLSPESQPLAYRLNPAVAAKSAKLPGLRKFGNITLKRGIAQGRQTLFSWIQQPITGKKINATTCTLELRDHHEKTVMSWTLHHAFVVKLVTSDLDSSKETVAIESMELACDSLTLSAKP